MDMSRETALNHSRNGRRINRLLVGLLVAGLSVPAFAQSTQFPTYQVGMNSTQATGPTYTAPLPNPWVVSDGTILTPAGTQVYLSTTTRAKAIALNPSGNGTAAVLQMGAPQSVSIFCVAAGGCDSGAYTQGQVMQTYSSPYLSGGKTKYDSDGSQNGIAYTPNGMQLVFSQDGYNSAYKSGTAYVTIANVNPATGLITSTGGANPYPVQVGVPLDVNGGGYLTNVTCFPYTGFPNPPSGSPGGTTGSILIPCGQTVSIVSDNTFTSYPVGIAIAPNGNTAYAVLDNNDTLTEINLTLPTPTEGPEIRVGNVPHSVVISPNGKTAYVSNEGGRIATETDFQGYSNGTPVVANNPTGATSTGTVSILDLSTFTVTGSINVGLHPTGMAFYGNDLLVANAYSDNISVINTATNTVVKTIKVGLPVSVPGEKVGAGPNSIAVDSVNNLAYVALYNANAVAVINLTNDSVSGLIPVGYAPSSVVLDATDGDLLVANDKGIGTSGYNVSLPPAASSENSYATYYTVSDYNTHEDLGTVSIVPVPVSVATLSAMTTQVTQNNHWDLAANIESASGGNPKAAPVAIPANIGSPSLIKHVFVIIRENRTYDQILGDVAGANGDASLAVFGDGAAADGGVPVTPNAHSLVQRFPILDNFYDPSRQSADGHNWITQAMAPYSDDIQSPDWLRDYPSDGGEALAYQKAGHLWDQAAKYKVSFKNYGEYIEYNTFNSPTCTPSAGAPSNTCEPLWIDFFNDITAYECGAENQLYNYSTVASHSPLPNLINNTHQNYPQFDLGIPDQFRFDIWNQDFQNDVTNGTVPQLEFMWISSDHTGGPPTAPAMEADNDLALGRFVDAISHSSIWSSSAIFVEEDDAQNGVDHVDGHRAPGYVFSPYVIQVSPEDIGSGEVYEDGTFYTQVNMTRTIEQILGIEPMNQNDLVASPMATLFLDNPPAHNFLPWTHVSAQVPLNTGVSQTPTQPAIPSCGADPVKKAKSIKTESREVKALRAGWMKKKAEIFAGKYHTPDSEDIDTVNHLTWYEATGFTRPFPGERTVRPASDFNLAAPAKVDDDD
jgi:YVTN family beta-propeller protein